MSLPSSLPQERGSSRLGDVIFGFLLVALVGLTFSIAVSSIGLTVAIGLWIVKSLTDRRWQFEKTPLDSFFLAYIAVEILAAIFALQKWESLLNAKRLFLILVVYLVATYVQSEKKVAILVSLLVAVTSLLSIVELIAYFEVRPERLYLFQHYMTTGGIKMIVLLLLLPFVLHPGTPGRVRVLGVVWGFPILLALVLTFTRSSWLGFIAGCMALGVLKNKYVIPVVLLLVVLFLLLAPRPLRERAYSIVDPKHPNNVGRVHLWTTGLKIFQNYPLLGVGDSDLHEVYGRYKAPDDIEPGGHLHNNILMWFVTLGTLGGAVLVALFGRILLLELSVYRSVKNHWIAGSVVVGSLAAFVGFHVNGLFEWNFGDQEIMLLVWTSVGLVLASEKFQKEKTLDAGFAKIEYE
jgi:O-antigen ligase